MRKEQSGKYRVIQRDGVLIVETDQAEPSTPIPKQPFQLPILRLKQIGVDLFQRRHYPELTVDGDAIVSAESLEKYLKLDARSYDVYYITPIQQSLLGYLGIAQYLWVGAAFVPIALNSLSFSWFLAASLLALVSAVIGWKLYTGHIESIHVQQYEPAPFYDADPVPGPNAPGPC